jgi:hypothetical protein
LILYSGNAEGKKGVWGRDVVIGKKVFAFPKSVEREEVGGQATNCGEARRAFLSRTEDSPTRGGQEVKRALARGSVIKSLELLEGGAGREWIRKG